MGPSAMTAEADVCDSPEKPGAGGTGHAKTMGVGMTNKGRSPSGAKPSGKKFGR
jgi:hypothetical protein